MTGGTEDAGPSHTDKGLVLAREIETAWPGIGEALGIAVKARASTGFTVFDSPASLAQEESDGRVLGLSAESGSKRADPPAIIYSPEFTWVKCAHEVKVDAGGERDRVERGDLGRMGLKGGAEGGLRITLADYRRFDAPVDSETAMSNFFARPRVALRSTDVSALGAGEAVTMKVGGTLSAKVALRWSDIFTTEIGLLTELLGRFARATKTEDDAESVGKGKDGGAGSWVEEDGDSFQERETALEEEPEANVSESVNTDVAEDESGDPLPTLGIRTRLSLYAVFQVDLDDTFQIVFSRSSPGAALRVSLRKADSIGRRTRISPRLNVSLLDGGSMQEALDATAEGLLGASPSWVRRLLRAADWAALNEVERALLGGVADRLGIEIDTDAIGTLADLRDAVEAVLKRAQAVLVEAAAAKVTAALSFEYSRIDAHETILEAELDGDHPHFHTIHSSLVLGRLGDLAGPDSPDGITVRRFLNQHSFECKRAWGASLNVGPFRAGGKDRLDVKQVRRTDMIGDGSGYSFRGVRSHKGQWMRDGFSWKATLAARSPTDRERERGRTRLVTSLYLLIERDEREITPDELASSLDSAVAWGILTPEAIPDTVARFAELTDGAERTDLSLHLRLGDVALRRALSLLPAVGDRDLARALAEAMPWHPLFPERQRPSIRRQLYTGLWHHYLGSNAITDVSTIASSAAALFRRERMTDLARYEQDHSPPSVGSFAEMARANPKTRAQWDRCRAGAGLLGEAIEIEDGLSGHDNESAAVDQPSDSLFAAAFSELARAWSQSHHFRAFGVLIRHLISAEPSAWRDVRRTLRIGYRRDGQRTVENITSRASGKAER